MTKSAKTAIVRGLCAAYPTDVYFGFDDLMLLNETLGSDFRSVRKVVHPLYGDNNHLEGDGEVFSWKQLISPKGPLHWVTTVMRQAIDLELRSILATHPDPHCCICGFTLDLTVDHKTTSFSEIASRFLAGYKTLPELEKDHTKATWVFKDPTVTARWLKYHNTMFDHQILCRSCNSKKGAR